ncbi:MAG: class I adenylate-forming enzyme family protein [Acidimicrobiales bacterium]
MRLRATFLQSGADGYRRPGGAWDVPGLDRLLSSPRAAGAPAVVDGDVVLDHGTLDRLASSVAGSLRALGVRHRDVVAWQLPNWWEAVVLFHACWRSGAVAAPIHHQVGSAEVERIMGELDPKVLLAAGGLPLADSAGSTGVIGVRTGDPRFESLLGGRPLSAGPARASDVAVVLFTSGSTGNPKAVLHSHRGLAYKAHSMATAHGLGPDDVALMPSPLAHVSGLLNSVLVPGAAGMPVVLMEKWDAERAAHLAGRHRASFMIGPPTIFLSLMDVPGYRDRVEHLRIVSCGAMGVTPEFIDTAREGLGALVKRTYGSTEAPTVTTSGWWDPADKARDTDGHSVGGASLQVVDPSTGRPLPAGTRGEVQVRGPELFVGYGDGTQTREAVRRGWFATGDLGVLDEEGWLTIGGRLKELIIRGGENIASAEVERVLEQHPGIRQAVVVGRPDDRFGERVVAFVVGDPAVDVAEARRWFAGQGVARFKTPEYVVHLDEVPVLGVGKPDRPSLRRRAEALSDGPG